MVRISGIDIPDNKRIEIALTYIKGVGRLTSNKILERVGISKDTRAKDISAEQLAQIRGDIEKNCVIEGTLFRTVQLNIKRLKETKCYRGLRHERGLPVRGQRTKTNARTRKGRKQTVGGTRMVREKH